MFTGTYTALITPFLPDGSVDFEAMKNLLEDQVSAGVEGVVVLGTTGESPTMTPDEDTQVIKFVVDTVNKRTKVIAGTGSNSTAEAVKYSQNAERIGVDGVLVVSPYYNKPTQKGLYEYFNQVCKSINIPVIAYNIEGRTGVNIQTPTLKKIKENNPNLVGVKEASGNLDQMQEVKDQLGNNFIILSGDDDLTLEIIKRGGHGVISVLSNLLPSQIKNLVDTGLSNDFTKAQTLHNELSEKMQGCFIETNPIGIKTIMAKMGKCHEIFRSPMTTMEPENKEKLFRIFGVYTN